MQLLREAPSQAILDLAQTLAQALATLAQALALALTLVKVILT